MSLAAPAATGNTSNEEEGKGTTVRKLIDWYHGRKRRARILLVAVPLIFVLSLGWWGLRGLALQSADSMTITIVQDGKGVVYARGFGPTIAQEAQRILNDPTLAEPNLNLLGFGEVHSGFRAYYGPAWNYTLDFKWHGFVVESASMSENGSPETYSISALGLPDPRMFVFNGAKMHSMIDQLAQESHVAIPHSPFWTPHRVAGP